MVADEQQTLHRVSRQRFARVAASRRRQRRPCILLAFSRKGKHGQSDTAMRKPSKPLLRLLAGPIFFVLLLALVWSERYWSVDAIFQKRFDKAESIVAKLDRNQSIQDANPHLNGGYYIFSKFDKEDRSGGNGLVMSDFHGRDGMLQFPKGVDDDSGAFETARYIVVSQRQYEDYSSDLYQMYSYEGGDTSKKTKVGNPHIAPTWHTQNETYEIYEIASGKLVAKKTFTFHRGDNAPDTSGGWFASLGLDVPR